MKVIILAAGQGTRLRPLTDGRPKCMVEVNGRSIIERQLDIMYSCGVKEEDITIVGGYRSDALIRRFENTGIQVIVNKAYKTTNMVCSLMCAQHLMQAEEDVVVSYGDIIYDEVVFQKILAAQDSISVIVDDAWYDYWSERCENPLDDAETLMFDAEDYLVEIGQKTTELAKVQSQYIGLMRFQKGGLQAVLELSEEAKRRSEQGKPLWRTDRSYEKMYMTDLLQGLIDEGQKLRAVHIQRGWFEIDDRDDLKVVETKLKGAVYWITGLSGAGKTTIGKLFYEKMREQYPNTVFLDGDTLRKVFGDCFGYSREERRKCAMCYARLCAMLQAQGMYVVCCTISMFDSVREWNRKNIGQYREVYVKVSMDTLQARDQKGLYSGLTMEEQKEVAGIHVDIEEPKCPDLILENDGTETPKEQAEKIWQIHNKLTERC